MRKLNRFVVNNKQGYRSINNVLLSKIVNVADDRYEVRKMADVTDLQRSQCAEIVKGLIELSKEELENNSTEEVERMLAIEIDAFSRSYKKKRPKKKKRTCKEEEIESLNTGHTIDEVIPKPKKRQQRSLQLKAEIEKS